MGWCSGVAVAPNGTIYTVNGNHRCHPDVRCRRHARFVLRHTQFGVRHRAGRRMTFNVADTDNNRVASRSIPPVNRWRRFPRLAAIPSIIPGLLVTLSLQPSDKSLGYSQLPLQGKDMLPDHSRSPIVALLVTRATSPRFHAAVLPSRSRNRRNTFDTMREALPPRLCRGGGGFGSCTEVCQGLASGDCRLVREAFGLWAIRRSYLSRQLFAAEARTIDDFFPTEFDRDEAFRPLMLKKQIFDPEDPEAFWSQLVREHNAIAVTTPRRFLFSSG